MPTKTLYIDGNDGTVMISSYGTSKSAITDPYSYLSSLYFHSSLPYIQIKNKISAGNLTFPAVAQGIYTWPDGSKGCGGGCYITTAVVGYMGLEDDDHVLVTLRNYRDTYMKSTPELKTLVKEYYATAPEVVRVIESRPDYKDIFSIIYNDYLLRAVEAIEAGKNEIALSIYTKMYLRLKKLAGL